MDAAKAKLMEQLEGLSISTKTYEHPVALTCEAQAQYLPDAEGALSKNLFLKDKKGKYYLLSALVDTKVDMKSLSIRLGHGKNGLRMAPLEDMTGILGVPEGCATPFAAANVASKEGFMLLLDQQFKGGLCLFHPNANDATVAVSTGDLETFLKATGVQYCFIDVEAAPVVGPGITPDLAHLATLPEELAQKGASSNHAGGGRPKGEEGSKKKDKGSGKKEKGSGNDGASGAQPQADNIDTCLDDLVHQIMNTLGKHMSNAEVWGGSKDVLDAQSVLLTKELRERLEFDLTMLKNAAYTSGFRAAVDMKTS
mmetsp:Transcript_10571/g.38849  ORF Transcript_10571/g.38849 Transcript_10571/m.38849 type:complete len:311 (+) Transcript_10571:108-1040(+)